MPVFTAMERWTGKTVRSFRQRGVVGTARRALEIVKDSPRRWQQKRDEAFDKRFGVDTSSPLELAEAKSDPRFKFSVQYGPTPDTVFGHALRQLRIEYGKFLFIDFGCGKGKALILAAERHFRRVIGIELSSQLIHIAEENLRIYLAATRGKDIFQLVCMDAGEYTFPEEPAIYYLANPFHEKVMRRVLENLRCSLIATPRESYIVYLEPELRNLLDEADFLKPIKRTSSYSIWKVVGPETLVTA